jgi:ribosomal protein S12 methylthiotransferase accessory factor
MSISDLLVMPQGGLKRFVDSTHRLCPPDETLRRFGPLMPMLGITRLANITGLDRIGIPVVIAVRPISRGLATAQGKGVDLPAAKASALMEAIETWHAERMEPTVRFASHAELRTSDSVLDIAGLQCRAGRVAASTKVFAWMSAEDIQTGRAIWVPLDAVACDFSSDVARHSTFLTTTNGLASGNHLLEATLHALCELVERDAVTLHLAASPQQRDARRLALDSIHDPLCRILMEALGAAGMDLAVWDCTSDLGVPVVSALIIDKRDNVWQWRPPRPRVPYESRHRFHPSRH